MEKTYKTKFDAMIALANKKDQLTYDWVITQDDNGWFHLKGEKVMDLQLMSAKEKACKLSRKNMKDYMVVRADLGLYCKGYAVIASAADFNTKLETLAYFHHGQEITERGE